MSSIKFLHCLLFLSILPLFAQQIHFFKPEEVYQSSLITSATTLYFGVDLSSYALSQESIIVFTYEDQIQILAEEFTTTQDSLEAQIRSHSSFSIQPFTQPSSPNTYFLPFKIKSSSTTNLFLGIKVMATKNSYSSSIKASLATPTTYQYIELHSYVTSFTAQPYVPKILKLQVESDEHRKSYLLYLNQDIMTVFFGDLISQGAPNMERYHTYIYGYKEDQISSGINKVTLLFYTNSNTEVRLSFGNLEGNIETFTNLQRPLQTIHEIEVKNVYAPYYFIGLYNNVNSIGINDVIYVEKLYGENISIFYNDVVEATVFEKILPSEISGREIEDSFIITQNKLDLITISCETACKVQINYISDEYVNKTNFNVDEIFYSVIESTDTEVTITYNNVNSGDVYDVTVLNAKPVTAYLAGSPLDFSNTVSHRKGICGTSGTFTIRFSKTTSDNVYIKGHISRSSSYNVIDIISATSQSSLQSGNYVFKLPVTKDYKQYILNFEDKSFQYNFNYYFGYGQYPYLHVPNTQPLNNFGKVAFTLNNPYINTVGTPSEFENNYYYFLTQLSGTSGNYVNVNITIVQFEHTQALSKGYSNLIEQSGKFRLEQTDDVTKKLLLMLSKCKSGGGNLNYILMNLDEELDKEDTDDSFYYEIYESKGYLFDIIFSTTSSASFKFYYTYATINEIDNFVMNDDLDVSLISDSSRDQVTIQLRSPLGERGTTRMINYYVFIVSQTEMTNFDICKASVYNSQSSFQSSAQTVQQTIRMNRDNNNYINIIAIPADGVNPEFIYKSLLVQRWGGGGGGGSGDSDSDNDNDHDNDGSDNDDDDSNGFGVAVVIILIIGALVGAAWCYKSRRQKKQDLLNGGNTDTLNSNLI